MVVPAVNAPWVNLMSSYIVDLIVLAEPFDTKNFSVLNASGKRIPKKFPHAMLAVKLQFSQPCLSLKYLYM